MDSNRKWGVAIIARPLIRLCGRIVEFLIYWLTRFLILLATLIGEHRRSVVGRCMIIAPPEKMKAILEGFTFLQSIDLVMFQKLTVERRYICFYLPKVTFQRREIFGISDAFLHWGKEGIATCLVQAVLNFALFYLPRHSIDLGFRHPDGRCIGGSLEGVNACKEVQQELSQWMKTHSFSPGLLKQYPQKIIGRQEVKGSTAS